MTPQTTGTLQIIAGAFCWGSLGLLGATLNRAGFGGNEVAALRIVIAACILSAVLPLFWRDLKQLHIRKLPGLALQSLLGMLGMSLCYFAAITHIGSSLAVALLYTAPVWSLIFARILLGESITPKSALLTVIAATGVGLTMAGGGTANPAGILFGLGSGICYALYGVLGKRAMQGNPPMLVFFTSITFSALVLLLMPHTHSAFAKLPQQNAVAWISALALACVGTIAAYGLFVKGLQKMPAAKASIFTVFEPLTAVVLAALFLNEQLNGWQYLGIALILGTAVLNTVRFSHKFPKPFKRPLC